MGIVKKEIKPVVVEKPEFKNREKLIFNIFLEFLDY